MGDERWANSALCTLMSNTPVWASHLYHNTTKIKRGPSNNFHVTERWTVQAEDRKMTSKQREAAGRGE